MVDTGSNISIVRPDILSLDQRRCFKPDPDSYLRTVTGETAPIEGKAATCAQIRG